MPTMRLSPTDRCGTCRRCIEACPTQALEEGRGLDARRCLSYLTIENRGGIPEEAAARMYPYFYGCDRCLRVCPHLRSAPPATEPAFTPRPELLQMEEEDWMALDVERYRMLFQRLCRETGEIRGPHPQPESTTRQRGTDENVFRVRQKNKGIQILMA